MGKDNDHSVHIGFTLTGGILEEVGEMVDSLRDYTPTQVPSSIDTNWRERFRLLPGDPWDNLKSQEFVDWVEELDDEGKLYILWWLVNTAQVKTASVTQGKITYLPRLGREEK